jgi:Fic family protein
MSTLIPEISPEMLRLIAEIEEFRGRWGAHSFTLRNHSSESLEQMRRLATISSIGASTRIAGSSLSNQEVATLLANPERRPLSSQDEEEVAGYADAIRLVLDSWNSLTVSEEHLRQLHTVLLQHSAKGDKDHHLRGEYKRVPNHVAVVDESGEMKGTILETSSPAETPRKMERLLGWYAEAERSGELHPLLVTGMFIAWFLAIHPFDEGNGRLSRILTTLLLLRAGYAHVTYASLEQIIEGTMAFHDAALRKTQQTLNSPLPDWGSWLLFFLRSLVHQKDQLMARMDSREKVLPELTELASRLIRLLADVPALSVAAAVQATGANRNTVKATLRNLAARELLVARGKGRGAHYTMGKP